MQPSGKSQVNLTPKPLPFLGYYGILQGHSKKGDPILPLQLQVTLVRTPLCSTGATGHFLPP